MAQRQTIDAMWDDSPIDVSTEVNFIWSIANKLRGTYQSDKYKDVIIPMVIIRQSRDSAISVFLFKLNLLILFLIWAQKQ